MARQLRSSLRAPRRRARRPLPHARVRPGRRAASASSRRSRASAPTASIRASGVSNYDAAQLRATLAAGHVDAIQNSYSLLVRDDERELLGLCAAEQVSYTVYSPLAGGWLTGKYRRGAQFPAGSRMTQRPEGYAAFVDDAIFDALERLEELASARGVSMAAMALGWLLANPLRRRDRRRPDAPGAPRAGARGARKPARGGRAGGGRGALSVGVIVLDEAAVTEHLPMAECIDAMESVLGALARGEAQMPLRSVLRGEGAAGMLGLMPAYRGGSEPVYSLKAVCVFPGNPSAGLDSHQGDGDAL